MMKPSHKETTEVTLNGGDVGQVIIHGVRSGEHTLLNTIGCIGTGCVIGESAQERVIIDGVGPQDRNNTPTELGTRGPGGGGSKKIGQRCGRVTKVALRMRPQLGHLGTPDVD